MKKLFTLIAALVCAVCVNAQNEVDIPINDWTWNYNAEGTSYENGVQTITLTGDWGQYSTGWDPVADWSKYGKLTVVIESYSNDWGKVYFKKDDKNIVEKSFGTITSTTSVNIDIDPTLSWINSVNQLAIQGKTKGDVIKISRVYLTEAIQYGEAKTLTNDGGFIAASQFTGLTDNAKIVFTYKIEGDITGYEGWGIGRIGSNDDKGSGPSVEIASLSATKLGEQTYTCYYSEIKPALVATPDGIFVNIWSFGDGKCKGSLVKVEAIDVVSTGINTVNSNNSSNNVRYNLLGVKNGNGIYIMNGKKYLK